MAIEPTVKSLKEVRAEQITQQKTLSQRQLKTQRIAQLSKVRREAAKVARRRDLPGYGPAFDVSVVEQRKGIEKSIGKAFETREKEIEEAAQKEMGKEVGEGSVVVLQGNQKVDKAWFDERPAEERTFMLENGLDKYRDKYMVSVGGRGEVVNKAWFNELTPEEQNELNQAGFGSGEYRNFIRVGTAGELVPKSTINKMADSLSSYLLQRYISLIPQTYEGVEMAGFVNMPTDAEKKYVRETLKNFEAGNKNITSPEVQQFINQNRGLVYRVVLQSPSEVKMLQLIEKYNPEGAETFYAKIDDWIGHFITPPYSVGFGPSEYPSDLVQTGIKLMKDNGQWKQDIATSILTEAQQSDLSKAYESFMAKYGLGKLETGEYMDVNLLKNPEVKKQADIVGATMAYAVYSGYPTGSKVKDILKESFPIGASDIKNYLERNGTADFWRGFVKIAAEKGKSWLDSVGFPKDKGFDEVEKWAFGNEGFAWKEPDTARQMINKTIEGYNQATSAEGGAFGAWPYMKLSTETKPSVEVSPHPVGEEPEVKVFPHPIGYENPVVLPSPNAPPSNDGGLLQ
jgi:hypothetical protein